MKINRMFALAIACVFVFFSGCSFSTNIESLLRAPKLSEEEERIYTALTDSVGKNITLNYPKSGDNLSAFIVGDFDGDGESEAIVFYTKNGSGGETKGNVRINVLDQDNGKWYSVRDRAADGSEIDKVEISKIGDVKRVSILVGYSITENSGKLLNIYQYNDASLNISQSYAYSYFHAGDFDGDSKKELLIIQNPREGEEKMRATLCWSDAGGLLHTNQVYLSNEASSCSNVFYANDNKGKCTGIYIDEMTGTAGLQTEVLIAKDKILTLAIQDATKTKRPSGLPCSDIDGNGKIDIPSQTENFQLDDSFDSTAAVPLTIWYSMRENGSLYEIKRGIYSQAGGIAFCLPSKWKQTVTVYKDSHENQYVVCEYNKQTGKIGDELLRIASERNEQEAMELEGDGFSIARKKEGMYYMIKITDTDSDLKYDEDEIKRDFHNIR